MYLWSRSLGEVDTLLVNEGVSKGKTATIGDDEDLCRQSSNVPYSVTDYSPK